MYSNSVTQVVLKLEATPTNTINPSAVPFVRIKSYSTISYYNARIFYNYLRGEVDHWEANTSGSTLTFLDLQQTQVS
jgi:hypothetical protein